MKRCLICFICLALNACSTLGTESDKTSMCKELKHRMIFNSPATNSSQNLKWQQQAGQTRATKDFNDFECQESI